MDLSQAEFDAIWLTLKLAMVVTGLLLVVGTPLAYWLARTSSRFKPIVAALVALPLVLPPTVLGFYLLLMMGPQGPIGAVTDWLGIGSLAFSFAGLVVGSIIYSLPFVVQPIQNTFESVGKAPMEAAASLGASPLDVFLTVLLPLSKRGFLTAAVLGFAHTLGEFGVVLMIGGNIPEVTQVVSVLIYEHVEALDYAKAHSLSAVMIIISFLLLTLVYTYNHKQDLARIFR